MGVEIRTKFTVETLTPGDVERLELFNASLDRLQELVVRAKKKEEETKEKFLVICIKVDDPAWTFLVDILMPGHDWQQYRDQGMMPMARGIVPRDIMVETLEQLVPELKNLIPSYMFITVLAGGGASIFRAE